MSLSTVCASGAGKGLKWSAEIGGLIRLLVFEPSNVTSIPGSGGAGGTKLLPSPPKKEFFLYNSRPRHQRGDGRWQRVDKRVGCPCLLGSICGGRRRTLKGSYEEDSSGPGAREGDPGQHY